MTQNFPQEDISEGWDEGKDITSISYGNGVWALVMSESELHSQQWWTRSYFPENEIKEGWDEGKKITSLTYGNGVWVLVMSMGSGLYSQQWWTRSNFPKDEIKEGWGTSKPDSPWFVEDLPNK